MLRARRPSVCMSVTLVDCGRCLGYLHAEADPDRIVALLIPNSAEKEQLGIEMWSIALRRHAVLS